MNIKIFFTVVVTVLLTNLIHYVYDKISSYAEENASDSKKAELCIGSRREGICCGTCNMCRYENSKYKL